MFESILIEINDKAIHLGCALHDDALLMLVVGLSAGLIRFSLFLSLARSFVVYWFDGMFQIYYRIG